VAPIITCVEKRNNYGEKGYGDRPYNDRKGGRRNDRDNRGPKDKKWKHDKFHGDKRKRDDDRQGKREEDVTSTNSLSGFGTGNGPKMFFNKKKSEMDTTSLKDASKSNPAVEVQDNDKVEPKTATPLEPIKEKESLPQQNSNNEQKEPIKTQENEKPQKSEIKKESFKKINQDQNLSMKKKQSDNDFVLGSMGDDSKEKQEKEEKHNHKGYNPPQADSTYFKKNTEEVLKPRHAKRGRGGKTGQRRPYGNRFSQLLETHQDEDSSPSPEKSKNEEEEKSKPTLIGDRPETEKFDNKAHKKYDNFNNNSRNSYHHNKRGYYHTDNWEKRSNYDNRSNRGHYRGGRPRGRYRNDRGRGSRRSRGRGRGGYGYNNHHDSRTLYDRVSERSGYDIESTHSYKQGRKKF
jgi:hypothetical protein